MATFTIRLSGVRFRAFHGVTPQEKKVGTEFIVDLAVEVDVSNPDADNLQDTVSYADLYETVKEKMAEPCDLIETVAWRISREISSRFTAVKGGIIRITKLSPPIPSFEGEASVEFQFP